MKNPFLLLSAVALCAISFGQQNSTPVYTPTQPSPSGQPAIGTDPQPNRGGTLGNILRAVTGEQDRSSATGTVTLQQLTQNWNEAARRAAESMFQKYGQPQEVTSQRLVWRNNGGWKETMVINEEVQHNFPSQHFDVLEQSIALQVPPEKIAELAQFSGSILVDRTKGEVSARCDSEENNTIALNLANDILRGRLNVEQARSRYAELSQAVKNGQRPSYSTGFQFATTSNTGFPDAPGAQQAQNWQRIGW